MKFLLNDGNICLIDDEDVALLRGYKPCSDGRYACVTRSVNGKASKQYIHRIIAKILHKGKRAVVDHVNGNKFDNRKENLRIVSQRTNTFNTKRVPPNRTGFPGVHFSPYTYGKNGEIYLRKKPFKTEIKHFGIKITLGRFETAEEAHSVYLAKKKELGHII